MMDFVGTRLMASGLSWAHLVWRWAWSTAQGLIRPAVLLGGLGVVLGLLLPMGGGSAWAESNPPDRLFLPLSVNFAGELILPSQTVDGYTLGGLSAIAYDRRREQFYALSDERGDQPPHLFSLKLGLGEDATPLTATVEGGITLKDAKGQPLAGTFDPEGMALKPDGTLFISAETDLAGNPTPTIAEFDWSTGNLRRMLPVPTHYDPAFDPPTASTESTPEASSKPSTKPQQIQGIQVNLGFEALTLSPSGMIPSTGEPIRLFTATEGPLVQDKVSTTTGPAVDAQPRNRLLHYYLGEGPVLILGEYVYPLERSPLALLNGLSDLLAIDNSGHFLALERALTPSGFQVKLFEIAIATATDISGTSSLRGPLRAVTPIQKKLLLDFKDLNLSVDNLEGLCWGPRLADGSRTLIMVSDNNFKSFQKTQLLVFRVSA